MQPYTLELDNGIYASVLHKREGKLRSKRILFIKIKNKDRLIAYTVIIGNAQYSLYKRKKGGFWLTGATGFNKDINQQEQESINAIKKAIDDYEKSFGDSAHLYLF